VGGGIGPKSEIRDHTGKNGGRGDFLYGEAGGLFADLFVLRSDGVCWFLFYPEGLSWGVVEDLQKYTVNLSLIFRGVYSGEKKTCARGRGAESKLKRRGRVTFQRGTINKWGGLFHVLRFDKALISRAQPHGTRKDSLDGFIGMEEPRGGRP